MAGKVCPIYSADEKRNCLEDECMLYVSKSTGGACGLVDGQRQLVGRIDTLSAQVQEMQVALIKLTNA